MKKDKRFRIRVGKYITKRMFQISFGFCILKLEDSFNIIFEFLFFYIEFRWSLDGI